MTASHFSTLMFALLVGAPRVVSGIIGGSVADSTRYPYFAGLLRTYSLSGEFPFMSGGTLIAPDVVLTNALYIDYYGDDDVLLSFKVRVNATSTKKSEYEYERNARLWIQHPDYKDDPINNDIALIFLDEPVTEVPLVKLNRKRSIPKTGRSYTELGFGVTDEDPEPDTRAEKLMEVTVETVPFDVCYDASYPPGIIEGRVFCAGSELQGHCWGDGGGPLLALSDGGSKNKDVQVGIIAFNSLSTESLETGTERCLTSGYPGGFIQLSHFTEWIDSSIRKHSKKKNKKSKKSRKHRKSGGMM